MPSAIAASDPVDGIGRVHNTASGRFLAGIIRQMAKTSSSKWGTESVGAAAARARFGELLERVARGESFEITKHGKPVGRLVPPNVPDQTAIAAAALRLRGFAKSTKVMSTPEILASRHEGHRI